MPCVQSDICERNLHAVVLVQDRVKSGVCLCVCVCVCMCIYMHTYICTCLSVCKQDHVYLCVGGWGECVGSRGFVEGMEIHARTSA